MGYGHWSMVIKINANIFVYPFSVIQILTLIFNNKSGKESLVHMKKSLQNAQSDISEFSDAYLCQQVYYIF